MKLFSRVFQHARLLWDALVTGFLYDEKDAFGRKPAKRDISSGYRFIIQREGLAYFHVEYDLAPAPLHSSPVLPMLLPKKGFPQGIRSDTISDRSFLHDPPAPSDGWEVRGSDMPTAGR